MCRLRESSWGGHPSHRRSRRRGQVDGRSLQCRAWWEGWLPQRGIQTQIWSSVLGAGPGRTTSARWGVPSPSLSRWSRALVPKRCAAACWCAVRQVRVCRRILWQPYIMHHIMVLRESTLDSACTVTTDYINFCVESIIPTKTVKVYPNNKTYITKDIKQIMNETIGF